LVLRVILSPGLNATSDTRTFFEGVFVCMINKE
jgi:hypothetical protein